jgi:DNA invertase Pin-like site-specific DNA recombinase
MLGVFAEFETAIRRERQMEGIAKAKATGVYKGRPPSIDGAEIRRLHAAGMGATSIAKSLGIGRASVYRFLGAAVAEG